MARRSRVTGGAEARRTIKELGKVLGRPLGEASRPALRPALQAAKAKAPRDSGALAESLTVKPDAKASRKLKKVHLVGPSKTFEKGGKRPVRYAHLVEFGTAPHWQPERGRMHPGTEPQPFLRPAFEETQAEVVKRFGEKIGKAVEAQARRLARKQSTPRGDAE